MEIETKVNVLLILVVMMAISIVGLIVGDLDQHSKIMELEEVTDENRLMVNFISEKIAYYDLFFEQQNKINEEIINVFNALI